MSKFLDVKVNSVREIASALLEYADTFSFVVREGKDISKDVVDLLEVFKPFLIEYKKVSEWPGTKLFWEKANLYIYHLNNETVYLLHTNENNLFNWLLPHLPEDLVFYRKNKPFFVSITHEREAYFELEYGDETFP